MKFTAPLLYQIMQSCNRPFIKKVIYQTQSVKLNLVTMTMVRAGTMVLVESIVFNSLFLHPYQQWPEPRNFLFKHPKIHFLVGFKDLNLKHLCKDTIYNQLRSRLWNSALISFSEVSPSF